MSLSELRSLTLYWNYWIKKTFEHRINGPLAQIQKVALKFAMSEVSDMLQLLVFSLELKILEKEKIDFQRIRES